jgi:hypothetical protein
MTRTASSSNTFPTAAISFEELKFPCECANVSDGHVFNSHESTMFGDVKISERRDANSVSSFAWKSKNGRVGQPSLSGNRF